MDEYTINACVICLEIVLLALYLVGPKLPLKIVQHSDHSAIFKLVSPSGRLVNDIHSFKRESEEGKLNAVSYDSWCNDGLLKLML